MIELTIAIIAFLALLVSVKALKENKSIREATFKPLLMPARIYEIVNDDNLFSCNFEYPISEDILGEPKLVYIGIKNVGKGIANNVQVINFRSKDSNPQIFRTGSNIIRIPENIIVPFLIRLSRDDELDYNFVTYITTIRYDDLFGNTFYLNMRLWIDGNRASVIEYNDMKEAIWKEHLSVLWRENESNGYFEARKIEDELDIKIKEKNLS